MKKIKKIFASIIMFFVGIMVSIKSKASVISTLYGVPTLETESKTEIEPTLLEKFIDKLQDVIIIPIIFLIGLIAYIVKSKSSIKKKVIVSLITIVVCILLVWFIG